MSLNPETLTTVSVNPEQSERLQEIRDDNGLRNLDQAPDRVLSEYEGRAEANE